MQEASEPILPFLEASSWAACCSQVHNHWGRSAATAAAAAAACPAGRAVCLRHALPVTQIIATRFPQQLQQRQNAIRSPTASPVIILRLSTGRGTLTWIR